MVAVDRVTWVVLAEIWAVAIIVGTRGLGEAIWGVATKEIWTGEGVVEARTIITVAETIIVEVTKATIDRSTLRTPGRSSLTDHQTLTGAATTTATQETIAATSNGAPSAEVTVTDPSIHFLYMTILLNFLTTEHKLTF